MVRSYYPNTYTEALELLDQETLQIIAGGTDLMVKKRNWSQLPPAFDKDVLFAANLEELNYIDRQGHHVHIGAGVTLEDILDHFHTPELLRRAIEVMASPAIRHVATLAGNVVNASPAGDSLPVLYLLDGVIVLESVVGIRHVPIESFIVGPGKTTIQENEIIKEIVLQDHNFNHMTYRKIGGRQADAISKVCFAGACSVHKHVIEDFRMAFGAVAPSIVRKKEIEKKVIGQSAAWLMEHQDKVADAYSEYIIPIDDQRSKAVYRKQTALNLMKDFVRLH